MRHFARDAELVALEVDDAIELLVSAATMACGNAPGVVAPARSLLGYEQRLLRLLLL